MKKKIIINMVYIQNDMHYPFEMVHKNVKWLHYNDHTVNTPNGRTTSMGIVSKDRCNCPMNISIE
ncbi:hypothetical protein DERP_006177 [Dermatophagoides pteronyssinus]|uniref:Uncharacterized protein n=1 Tax=Dermatophagoides pteronyssinus TaxID=6956 RepID=A0ABQ8IY18_DERPT|nr:hypothetical protein DERP_006177 [Dermatophagoides pteronyssinus]